MIPILFSSSATTFTTQGIGALSDAVLGYVEEERNGAYEGWIKYPVTGVHYSDISLRSIILAKPNYTDDPQPFRVYEISKPMNGIVTIRFRHISYDLSGYPVGQFTASTLSAALAGLTSNCPLACPFTLTTTRAVTATFETDVPASIRSWLGGKSGSLLDVYGGEWSFDTYTAKLETARGADRGVTIRYGKNMTDLEQEESCAAVYTGVYPYWTDSYGENLVELTAKIVNNTETTTYASATYDYDKILPLDLSDKWDSAPTAAQLKTAAIAYIEDNLIGTPKVNLRVSFAQLSNLIKDRVDLCDTVTVQFEKLGISASAKCIKTRWNILLDRYEEITLGDARTTIAETIATTKTAAEKALTKSSLETAIDSATAQITGNNGGYVVLHDSDADGEPDELLIMNTADIDTATKVWRFNQAGLGYSSTGYDGTYGLAMTADGAIVADYITTGTLDADLIKAGILQDAAGLNYWNMETGEVSLQATGVVDSITTFYATSQTNDIPQWDYETAYLYDSDGEELYDADGEQLIAEQIWTTTVPTSAADGYSWMRNYIVYKDGTTELTTAVPLQDYYGRANLVMKASTDSSGNPIGILSGLADYMKFTAGQLEITSPQFTLDRYGNATFAGNLSAATGTFAGSLSAATGTFAGSLSAATGTFAGELSAATGTFAGDLSAAGGTFSGALNAATGSFSGAVTATSLTLGTGVTIDSDSVDGLATVATTGSYDDLSSTPDLTVYVQKDGTIGTTPASGVTGFKVSSAGLLQASNAIIYGTIYATNGTFSGTVSGSTVTGSTISSSEFTAADGEISLDDSGIIIRNGATTSASTALIKLYIDSYSRPNIELKYRSSTSDTWTSGGGIFADPNNSYSRIEFIDSIIANNSINIYNQSGYLMAPKIYISNQIDDTSAYMYDFAYYDDGVVLKADTLYLNDTTAVGTLKTASGSTSTIASGTRTDVASVSLTAGTWLIHGQVRFGSNSSAFTMQAGFGTTSGTILWGNGGYQQISVNAANTAPSLNTYAIFVLTATTTVYLIAYQNSGSSMTVTTSDTKIRAVCIA